MSTMWGAIQWPRGLDTEQFLREYWQRKPLLIRGAFRDFHAGLSADDVAGLALEEEADSRLITGNQQIRDWQLRHGPFDETVLTGLPERDWTLLVCGLEHWWPPAADLLGAFRFLPDWRIDDLMVSVAGVGGSVGPHVDQYDVFLLQAAGQRHWSIARDYPDKLIPNLDLAILEQFEPEQDWSLEPGDMLYLPPGVAHHGVAGGAETCMTFSIGFRAPSAQEWLDKLIEPLSEHLAPGQRYRDPGQHNRSPAYLDGQQVEQLRALLASALDDPAQFRRIAATALTLPTEAPTDAHEPTPERIFSQRLAAGDQLRRSTQRALLLDHGQDDVELISGEHRLPLPRALAELLLDSPANTSAFSVRHGLRPAFGQQQLSKWLSDRTHRQSIRACLNHGILEWTND